MGCLKLTYYQENEPLLKCVWNKSEPEKPVQWFYTVDPKAEKYYAISSYAYCAGNPVKFIDPDGNEFVDANGKKITYSKEEGWSKNATNDIILVHAGLMQTKTGTTQWEKGYNSNSKLEMNIIEEKIDGALGTANQAIAQKDGKLVKTDKVMQIKISIGSIKDSYEGKNKGLTLFEAIAATAGHEIEHTTDENRDIGVFNRNFPFAEKNIEQKPEKVGSDIRNEFRKTPRMEEVKLNLPVIDIKSLAPENL